jgi:UDP-N-acetyl-D-mannosaminuronic acid transferase (WecB/TagA/CpsF family)
MRIDELNLTPAERAELEAWGEQMAAKAEQADPSTLRAADPAIEELQRAAARRIYLTGEAERAVREAVEHARAKGLSWNIVGQALGTTGEAARQRYSAA